MNPERSKPSAPPIPDHALVRRIATGSYGSVWLARNILGSYRAVKIVRRATFKSERQYEREFQGVRNFEPISRSHPGFVQILHVGRDDVEGHFYYVMEVADDATQGQRIPPAHYSPRTLRSELDRRHRLPIEECLLLGQTLLLALEELHARNLVHRDLKPANIIYVEGVPKLADIGTVAIASNKDTPVGSIGYNPPEGSGQATGDIFSFGRLLYEMFSGVQVQELHDALPDLRPRLKEDRQHRFYDVIQKACSPIPGQRFASAAALRDALGHLLPLNDRGAVLANGRAESTARVRHTAPPAHDPDSLTRETANGAVPPDSRLYVLRAADQRLAAVLAQRPGLIVINGEAQSGKTSLLGRGLEQARARNARVAFTDLQKFNAGSFRSLEMFYQTLADSLSDQLELPVPLRRAWDPRRSANANLDRYLRREVLASAFGPLVWGLDEVARLQGYGFQGEFCDLLRAWCGERTLEPGGPLARLTVILVVPAHLRLGDGEGCQPMLDFGEQVALQAFSVEELAELNRQCGSPLRTRAEVESFHQLVNGAPFLSRYGLLELARRDAASSPALLKQEHWPTEIFAQPLQRLRSLLADDDSLKTAMRHVLNAPSRLDHPMFQQLRRAGLVLGDSPANARFPCELYAQHLRRHLEPV